MRVLYSDCIEVELNDCLISTSLSTCYKNTTHSIVFHNVYRQKASYTCDLIYAYIM